MCAIRLSLSLPCVVLGLALAALPCRAQAPTGKDEADAIEINDQLTTVDPIDQATGSHHKVHVVKLLASKTYMITIVRKDDKQPLSPYLRIEDPAGKQLFAQNHFGAVRSRFTPPSDAIYHLTVGGGTGEYVLRISPSVPINVLKDHDLARTIDVGRAGFELNSRLTAQDPRDKVRMAMHARVYLVKLTKDKTYSIEMRSRQFDAYLRLEDPAGKNLAEDDDSGGNLDALLVFRAPVTGVYRLIATSFAPNAQGDYLLRVQEE